MRRIDKAMAESEAMELLYKCEYGILSTIGNDGYPYGVPVNYVCKKTVIYFHSASIGHKLNNIDGNNKVSFCVVGDTEVIPEKFSTKYESVIIFGNAKVVTNDSEKRAVLLEFINKYAPNYMKNGQKYISSDLNKPKVIRIDIEHITGKKAKE